MPLYGMHDQPERARSFGEWADEYDRHRPSYADGAVDDLLADTSGAVLDIACGTGAVARLLTARGADVLGVEPDARMAEVASGHGIQVEVARFEDWDDRGRRFGLLTCGSAWHWLDPAVAARRVPALLLPGGLIARLWTYHVFDADVLEALDDIYDRLAPGLDHFGHDPSGEPEPPDPLREVPELEVLPSRTYRWAGRLTADEWVDRIATYSSHQRLGAATLRTVQDEVSRLIEGLGGAIECRYGTIVLLARRR